MGRYISLFLGARIIYIIDRAKFISNDDYKSGVHEEDTTGPYYARPGSDISLLDIPSLMTLMKTAHLKTVRIA